MESTQTNRTERKTTRRYSALECRALLEKDDRHLRGRTLDVSSTGVRIQSDADVTVGESVVLTLCLPDGTTWIDATGRVARVEQGLREADSGRAIGIEFSEIDAGDRDKLLVAIGDEPETVSRRGIFRLGVRRWG